MYQIILPGDRGTRVWTTPIQSLYAAMVRPEVEPLGCKYDAVRITPKVNGTFLLLSPTTERNNMIFILSVYLSLSKITNIF